jgi:hypothetical protein
LYQHRTIVRVLEDAAAMVLHETYAYGIEQVELALAQTSLRYAAIDCLRDVRDWH